MDLYWGDARRRLTPQAADFDDSILCAACDNELGKLDRYAAAFCRRCATVEQKTYPHFFVSEVDTDKLARFAASIIWRSAISRRPRALVVAIKSERVELLRVASFGITSPVVYPKLALVRYHVKEIAKPEMFMMTPFYSAEYGHDMYAFAGGGFRWHVQVAPSEWPIGLSPAPINGSPHVTGYHMSLEESPEMREAIRTYAELEKDE